MKEKPKEQNSSRIAEPRNGLTGTKGKGIGEDGWVGRDKGREGERSTMIRMHNGWRGRKWRAAQHREDK